jgi:hypothetical protein
MTDRPSDKMCGMTRACHHTTPDQCQSGPTTIKLTLSRDLLFYDPKPLKVVPKMFKFTLMRPTFPASWHT